MPESTSTIPRRLHAISLKKAIEMTTRFRAKKEDILEVGYKEMNILPVCETFDKESVLKLLSQPTCESFRIYYSMDEDFKLHAILVGADASGADILTGFTNPSSIDKEEQGVLLEEASRCPHDCPPESPLNH